MALKLDIQLSIGCDSFLSWACSSPLSKGVLWLLLRNMFIDISLQRIWLFSLLVFKVVHLCTIFWISVSLQKSHVKTSSQGMVLEGGVGGVFGCNRCSCSKDPRELPHLSALWGYSIYDLNGRHLFFHSFGGEQSKIKVSAGWFLQRPLSWPCSQPSLSCVFTWSPQCVSVF